MPNARVSHDAVGLAGASASYHRGGWEDRAARSAVNAAATSAERGAQAVHRDPGREAQGSLDQPNERTSALKRALGRRVGYSPWSHSRPDNGLELTNPHLPTPATLPRRVAHVTTPSSCPMAAHAVYAAYAA